MAESVTKGYFPSQVVSDVEKASIEYGTQVAQAIEQEWFSQGRTSGNRYLTNWNNFHMLRSYARGEQSIQKYKDELSINGDLSYLNLDWKPVPIIPKFVDIVVNGIAERTYDIKAYSQDPYGVAKRTAYMESVLKDMATQDIGDFAQQAFGINIYENNILDSVKLSKIVFKDPYKLKSLNSIIHPAVAKDFESFIKTINGDYIVKEVAIIFETNTEHNYNKIVLIRAPLEERIKRVILRDNLSREDVIKRVNNQIDDSTIIDNCDYIIENNNLKDLKEKVLKIHKDLIR